MVHECIGDPDNSATVSGDPVGRAANGYALTIGVFDGVHRGHQALLAATAACAEQAGPTPAALTFHPSPRHVLRGEGPPLILPVAERVRLLRSYVAGEVLVHRFDTATARLSAEEFVTTLPIAGPLRTLVVGQGFRLGRNREAGAAELTALGSQLGWSLLVVPPVVVEDEPVSSTRVRTAVGTEGDVEGAARLLGRPFELFGTVALGDKRGRTIGVPTANLQLETDLLVPAGGVYYCTTYCAAAGLVDAPAVVNVGVRPTFEGTVLRVEAHVLDWDGDLYDREMSLRFHDRLRDERRFTGGDELVAQIHRDVLAARSIAAAR